MLLVPLLRPCSGIVLEADCNFVDLKALVAAKLLKIDLGTDN